MGIAVLGPLEVDGHTNGMGPRDRVVLSALVVRAGDPVSTEGLADALWGDQPPPSWAKVVQGCVVRLRKRLGTAAIESGPFGYRLALSDDELDIRVFERALERAREALAADDPERASYVVREALDLWRGQVLEDLEEWQPGRVEVQRLEGLRMDAEELWVEAETRSGHAATVLERARALVAEGPLRERRWALLAVALYQAGRQGEALAAVKRARAMLVDELGLDPGHDLVRLEEQLLRQDPSLDIPLSREISASCPYRGLLPYGADDADSFFGREEDVAACLRRLRDTRVLAVVGPSGVGKSSLVRAGVVAALGRGGAAVLVTTPGTHPMESLAALKRHGRQTLVVDQAEEAVTVCADMSERERYFAALANHVGAGGGLVLSLRADHLGDLAPYPDIARVLEEGLYLLGPLSEPDLRSAIEGPARHAGLRLEPGLVDLLVRDVEGEPAALPMLSHVLRETWQHREGPTLTVAGYRATGGIRSAVSQSAERLYDAMDTAQRSRLRTLLLRLVMPTEDGDPVRARVPHSKVAADDEHHRLVELLVNARLVSIDGDSVQIAHEALVRVWPRLRGWLDDDIDGQRLFRHLASAADAWEGMGRPDSELYRGARLARTEEWRARAEPDLNDVEVAFLDASTTLAAAELRAAAMQVAQQKRTNRRLRGAMMGVGVLLVLSLVAGLGTLRSADRAAHERDLAARERDRASQAADLAGARRAGAQGALHEDLATALLLTVQSVGADDSAEAWENLGAVLTRAGAIVGRRDIGAIDGRPGTAWMSSLTASTDGSLVAGCVLAGGIRLLDATGLELMPFEDQVPGCTSLALSPDGARLAVALGEGGEQPIRLYDLPGCTLSRRQPGGFPPYSGVQYTERNDVDVLFSHDGSRMVAQVQQLRPATEWSTHGRLMVWDTADPSEPVFVARLPRFAHAALSPDGGRLYVAVRDDLPLRVYDVRSGRLVTSARDRLISAAGAAAVDISPDGSTLAVATRDRVVRYDTATLRPRGDTLTGHTSTVTDVAFSHDGRLVAASSGTDRTTVVWDGPTGDLLHRYISGGPTGLAFSGDDRTLLNVGSDGLLLAWNLAGASRQLTLGEDTDADAKVYSLSLPAPDGRTVARLRGGMLSITDTRTGESTPDPARTRDQTFVWSPDSRWLASTGEYSPGVGQGRYVTLWDASTGSIVARSEPFAWDTAELRISFSSDAEQVFVSDLDSLYTLARESMRRMYPAVPLGSRPGALVPHPVDGSVFVLDQVDGSYVHVDPRTGDVLDRAQAGLLATEDVDGVMSPDGNRMVVTGPGGRVRLLDVDDQAFVDPDSGWSWGQAAFAHDGSQYAIVQAERIRLWDGRTGEYQASLPLPTRAGTFSISYRLDSTGLVITSTDGRIWTADTRIDRWVERACAIAGRNLSHEEWEQFFPDRAYERTCPEWPDGI